MTNVVRLNALGAVYSPLFNRGWEAFPETGRKRSSRKVSWPEWQKAAYQIGEERLLGAIVRYTAQDKDHRKECGAPGFDRWLKWARYETWDQEIIAIPANTHRFPDDAAREAAISRFGGDFVSVYLDPCELDGTTIIARTDFAIKKMMEHRNFWKEFGFSGMRKR